MKNHRQFAGLATILLVFVAPLALASEGSQGGIGFYTAVSGRVTVVHQREALVLPVKLHDEIRFKDVVQTQNESRTKAFFQDDSMLTIGENSRIEINEYIYNPEENVRLAVVNLLQGQVRALVSKVFKANGSRFEIHTPSAVAAARGTYFTVWVENEQSGIINIGEKGRVDFTSGGTTVAVDPGYFSIAYQGKPPSAPAPHFLSKKDNSQAGLQLKSSQKTASNLVMSHNSHYKTANQREKAELILASSPAGLARALASVEQTLLREAPLVESPAQALQALKLDGHLVKALTALTSLSNASQDGNATGQGNGLASVSVTAGGATVAVTAGPVSLAPIAVVPVVPIIPVVPVIPVMPVVTTIIATPPAVINGALNLPKLP